ncbi:rhomboid-like protein [Anaeramoeba ignava]|uniref:Rhomboid-like protein n=1 Tax=Anaeramoeba ignava TaxID=1746090 RepID=A0A9Q0L533_ANAIG|nr:rhomboid-like protein [Anaeramoeba ignava]
MSIIDEIKVFPFTSIIIVICCVVWFYLKEYNISFETVGLGYETIIYSGEFWRILTSHFSHSNIFHLIFNMTSFWELRFLENDKFNYFKNIFILIIGSSFLTLIIYHFLITKKGIDRYRNLYGIGYSCVVFGLQTQFFLNSPGDTFHFFNLLEIPSFFAPFFSLLFTQLIFPQASFIGHLSGILVGFLINFHCFFWMNYYLTFSAFFWFFLIVWISRDLSNRTRMII